MPGKILATYLARITLREPEPVEDDTAAPVPVDEPPTNERLAELVAAAIESDRYLSAHVTSERTDR